MFKKLLIIGVACVLTFTLNHKKTYSKHCNESVAVITAHAIQKANQSDEELFINNNLEASIVYLDASISDFIHIYKYHSNELSESQKSELMEKISVLKQIREARAVMWSGI